MRLSEERKNDDPIILKRGCCGEDGGVGEQQGTNINFINNTINIRIKNEKDATSSSSSSSSSHQHNYSTETSRQEFFNFKTYLKLFNKSFTDDETLKFRQNIYYENVKKYQLLYNKYVSGDISYLPGITKFFDYEYKEISDVMKFNQQTVFINKSNLVSKYDIKGSAGAVSKQILKDNIRYKNFNWKDYKILNGVKNQGNCGSCWAFSVVDSLESRLFLQTNINESLSIQELIDCTNKNYGCDGGYIDYTLDYIVENKWLNTEKSYFSYNYKKDTCLVDKDLCSTHVSLIGYNRLKFGDEEELKYILTLYGPLPIAIHISENFLFYKSGIFSDVDCDQYKLNHAVLLVGYGEETLVDGRVEKYWVIKNSWGGDFGEDGYFRLKRDSNNMCGVASMAYNPILHHVVY